MTFSVTISWSRTAAGPYFFWLGVAVIDGAETPCWPCEGVGVMDFVWPGWLALTGGVALLVGGLGVVAEWLPVGALLFADEAWLVFAPLGGLAELAPDDACDLFLFFDIVVDDVVSADEW